MKQGEKINLEGIRFSRLFVIKRVANRKNQRMWECICDCGNHVVKPTSDLTGGNTRSCGCLHKESAALICKKYRKTHGLSIGEDGKMPRIYRIWAKMKSRCNNKNESFYYRYGGRGITVCDEWHDFIVFYRWAITNGYSDELTIERINNDRGYCPDNCAWIPIKAQAANRHTNRIIEFNGELLPITHLATKYKIMRTTLEQRLKRGWSIERAIKTPVRKKSKNMSIKALTIN